MQTSANPRISCLYLRVGAGSLWGPSPGSHYWLLPRLLLDHQPRSHGQVLQIDYPFAHQQQPNDAVHDTNTRLQVVAIKGDLALASRRFTALWRNE